MYTTRGSVTTAILVLILSGAVMTADAQAAQTEGSPAARESLIVHADQTGPTINKEIFGQFAEMLGEGVYGGIWVGPHSPIPNVRGIRSDVVQALRAIKVPVVRWPGGCYADEYRWRDGIGPIAQRRKALNSNWGGVLEPNTFGTDEFMDFVQQIDSQAYISINLGSGSPEEAADWLEYMTTDRPTTLGLERTRNGHPKPYIVRYLGLGNESWGCGGPMTPDEYISRMKLFSHFVRSDNPAQGGSTVAETLKSLASGKFDPTKLEPGPNAMKQIASGPDATNPEFTEALMKAWSKKQAMFWSFQGLSLHSYTFGGGFPFSYSATDFGENEYAKLLKETLRMEQIIALHSGIMDKYDTKKQVALVVDEWGAWLRTMPDTNPLFLRQQNSLRDAILASLNLDIFAHQADRVRMTNIAQMVNVLQSMILTDKEKMVLTPTYYVYKMYVPFQDATFLPVSLETSEYKLGSVTIPKIHAIAARAKGGHVWLALTNVDPNQPEDIHVRLAGISPKSVTGEVLTAPRVDAVNTFTAPNTVLPKPFTAQSASGELELKLLPKSVTVVRVDE